MKKINLLGSGGSIGTQTVDVCRRRGIGIHSAALKGNYKLLAEQAKEFSMKRVCVFDEEYVKPLRDELFGSGIEILSGIEGLCTLAADNDADITVNSVVGMVGLKPTIAALESGLDVALANKETLVAGGDIVMKLAADNNCRILPVDSEHSAIFQCLMCSRGEQAKQLKKIILTASGGSFFGKKYDELEDVTVEQALCHPNWSMGRKITIDSSSMMNKGLELIEACHLFNVKPSQVEIVIHRQSVVHSAVVFSDNAVIAQLGVPDMTIPIQYALTFPDRLPSSSDELSLTDYGKLTFEKPDLDTFRCLAAAIKAADIGGTCGSILNGANERAVELFLEGKIRFNDISRGVLAAIDNIPCENADSVDKVLSADKAARTYIDNMFGIV